MNETLRKVNAEFQKSLAAKLADKAWSDVISRTKDAADSDAGSFKVVVSTDDVDRQGESVDQAGWDLSYYKTNPVVLWAHDYSSLPIGVCTAIDVINGKLTAEGKFAPAEANPFAQQVRKLYDLGMVRTTSVGFIPREFDQSEDGVITKSELLEFSFVPVPANPHALTIDQIKKLNIDTAMLKTKGIDIKAGKPGDRCELDDGTPGILSTDNDGDLVCVPDKGVKEAGIDIHKTIEVFKDAMSDEHDRHHGQHMKLHGTVKDSVHKAVEVFKDSIKEASETFKDSMKSHKKDEGDGPVPDYQMSIHKALEVFCDAIDGHHKDHHEKASLENERHSKSKSEHMDTFCNAIKDSMDEGTDEGGNPTNAGMKAVMDKLAAIEAKLTSYDIALGDLKSPDGKGSTGGDADAAARSKSSKALLEINEFVETRQLLRSIDNSIEKVLRNFNAAARNQ